jgi:hypothetical protein
MTSRSLLALLITVAACSGGHSAGGAPPPARSTSPVPGSYSADQLTQALLTEISGYQQSGIPQSGQYGSLAAVQNSVDMQQAVKIDKPQCLPSTHAVTTDRAVRSAPAALIAFTKGDSSRPGAQSVSETLLAVGPDVAAQQVRNRVPAGCRTFRVRVSGRWSAATVVEPDGARIGEGSRTVGVVTTGPGTGWSAVRTWIVVLRSRGYLAAITLFGPTATQAEAEKLARRAYQQAERILP